MWDLVKSLKPKEHQKLPAKAWNKVFLEALKMTNFADTWILEF